MSKIPSKKQKTFHSINYNALHCTTLAKQKHCDVTFRFKDDELFEIGAHKMMLFSVSDVFETMFYGKAAENDVVDNHNKIILIEDISGSIFKKFLQYIYGKPVDFEDCYEIAQFFYAAHKYNCKNALMYITKVALHWLCSYTSVIFYETALLHDVPLLKGACINEFKENLLAVLSSSTFLSANTETVNYLFQLECSSVHSEIDYVWALERYIGYNEKNDPDVALKIRPAINSIRFLTLNQIDIERTSLLSHEEMEAIVKCLPEDADLSMMPTAMSQSRTERIFAKLLQQRDYDIISELHKIHTSHKCSRCSSQHHFSWECHLLDDGAKEDIVDIHNRYDHSNLVSYTTEDLNDLYEAYKNAGLVQ